MASPVPPDELDEPPQSEVVEPPCAGVAASDYYTASAGATLVIPYEAGLIQNDVLCGGFFAIDIVIDPAHGTVVQGPDPGSFEYTPDPASPDTDSFTYSLTENNVEIGQALVTIWVISDDCTVVAFADGFSTAYETTLSVPGPGYAANDILDCQPYEPFVFQIQSGPTHGTLVDQGDGAFEYQPQQGFTGLDKFVYHIRGGNQNLLMAKGVVSIIVDGAACVAVDDFYIATVDQTLTIPAPGVLGNDTLCDDYNYGVYLAQQPSHGQVMISSTGGDFEYIPDPGYVGQDTFTYELWGDIEPIEVLAAATVVIDVEGADDVTTTTVTDPTTTMVADTTTTTTTTVANATTTTTTTEVISGSTTPESATTVPDRGAETSVAGHEPWVPMPLPPGAFRAATFNASLSRAAEGELFEDLSTPNDPQAANVAEIIQRTRPDIVLLNEFDYVKGGAAVEMFRTNYLAVAHNGSEPIDYPYSYIAPTNTGVPSGFDLDNDGTVGGPDDAFGFGDFEGQFGMVVLSRFPIVADGVRTFQNLLWASMPGARLPDDPATPEPADWYSPEELAALRLSSTSHWDVPVYVGGRVVHVLAAHPTPPVLDGPEDRNGLRHADEIRLWADYVAGPDASWIVDDAGMNGGLAPGSEFIIVGDLNSDPVDGDSVAGATEQLLRINGIQDPAPTSEGAVEAAVTQGSANEIHTGDPALDTADFTDDAVGNLRVDYVLPSNNVDILAAGVFWPSGGDDLSRLVTIEPEAGSDHRLVWVDLI